MPDMILLETEEQMEERLDGLKRELAKVRTGRANPKMFDDVKVEYYGVLTPISQVGSIAVPEPSQIIIKPYDSKIVKDVEKSIHKKRMLELTSLMKKVLLGWNIKSFIIISKHGLK